jgi:hypothetical protein
MPRPLHPIAPALRRKARTRVIQLSVVAATWLASAPAGAQYATSPDETDARENLAPEWLNSPTGPDSPLRVAVGPALRASRAATLGGLASSLDLGAGTAGVRLSGNWTGVGSAGGVQQYGGDLWLDLRHGAAIRPVLGAGAAWLRREDAEGQFEDVGVATVRASLEYALGFTSTDARIGLDSVLCVPAIAAASSAPSVLFVGRLGLGI